MVLLTLKDTYCVATCARTRVLSGNLAYTSIYPYVRSTIMVFRNMMAYTIQEGHLGETLSLQVPTNLPLVVVFSAVYGTPGEPKRGRGKVTQQWTTRNAGTIEFIHKN